MNRRSSLVRSALFVVALMLSAAACGIPTDQSAQRERFPEDLLDELPPTTATAEPQPESDVILLSIYFHNDNAQLIRVKRPGGESPPINDALQSVVDGPTEEEQRAFAPSIVLTLLPSNLNPRVSRIDDADQVAYITVADEAGFRNNPDRRQAAAELVCTAVQFIRVDGVYIVDSQGIISLTDLDARPISGPANASHYDNCQSPIPTPSSTTTPTAATPTAATPTTEVPTTDAPTTTATVG